MCQVLAFVIAVAAMGFLQPPIAVPAEKNAKSMVGTWKVKLIKIDGKEPANQVAPWKAGTIWKLKKNGTGQFGAEAVTRWSYDDAEAEFSAYGKSLGFDSRTLRRPR